MRLYSLKIATIITLGIVLFTACVKDEEKKGCLDITAANYDPSAEVNEGCTYTQSTLPIFENGSFGTWGDDPIYFFACLGTEETIAVPVEQGSQITFPAMALVTDSNGVFFGYYVMSNNHDTRYYSSTGSKLNYTAQRSGEGTSLPVGVYIRGVDPEDHGECDPVLVSDRQTIMTGDLSSTEMTQVQMSILDFNDHNLNGVGVLGGFEYSGEPLDTFLIVNNVTWTNF